MALRSILRRDEVEHCEATMTVEAVLGLRARAGSREALLRAAFDLVDTTPGLTVIQRSLVWDCTPPEVDRCAALCLTTHLGIDELRDAAQVMQDRVTRDIPAGSAPLRIDLLWAHDPSGVATPPIAPAGPPVHPSVTPEQLAQGLALGITPERPPMPAGRIVMHPDVRTRASACGPLIEVAPEARDPETTRFASEMLHTVPEPYIERPQPFTPEFEITRRGIAGGVAHAVAAREPADLLAAAAEAYAWAQRCAEPIGPKTVLPVDAADVAVPMPPGITPEERVLRWLRAVQTVIGRERLWPRRVVVLQDAADWVRGAMFGRVHHTAPALGDPRDVVLSVAPSGLHRAEIGVVTSPAAGTP
jgi:7,8-dihydro-6-hydroxymethylpterin-pyrophosphokinase